MKIKVKRGKIRLNINEIDMNIDFLRKIKESKISSGTLKQGEILEIDLKIEKLEISKKEKKKERNFFVLVGIFLTIIISVFLEFFIKVASTYAIFEKISFFLNNNRIIFLGICFSFLVAVVIFIKYDLE